MFAFVLLRFHFALCVGTAFLFSTPAQAVDVCIPPQEPFLPTSDEELQEYADLIEDDFQRYFKEITEYFTCMDNTRQQAFEEAQAFSGTYKAFLERLDNVRDSESVIRVPEGEPDTAEGQ